MVDAERNHRLSRGTLVYNWIISTYRFESCPDYNTILLMGEFASCRSSIWIESEETNTYTNLCTLKQTGYNKRRWFV